MTELIQIKHATNYNYDRAATLGTQCIRLKPNGYDPLKLESYALKIVPEPESIDWYVDVYGNQVASASFDKPTTELHIEVDFLIRLQELEMKAAYLEGNCVTYPYFYSYEERKKIHPFLGAPEPTPLFEAYCDQLRVYEIPTLELMDRINKKIFQDITYNKRFEPGIYSPEETLRQKTGCCRDVAWLLVNIFRKLGMAARFVSGYAIRGVSDETGEREEVDLHAWCEVYLTGMGWIGLDATSGLYCGALHIPLAAAAYPFSTAPVEGVLSKCFSSFWVEMQLNRITTPASQENRKL